MPLGSHIALMLLVAFVTSITVGVGLWWAVGKPPLVTSKPWTAKEGFDFIKIILTVVGGIGGVVALVVSYRKQRLGEVSEIREDARLFGEDFTRATEQLGSKEAPVRLAGIYALERLAQNNPGQRQTIVNVICSYLRMPYKPPTTSRDSIDDIRYFVISSQSDEYSASEPARKDAQGPTNDEELSRVSVTAEESNEDADRLSNAGETTEKTETIEQERQVRLTAQQVLASHLKIKHSSGDASQYWDDIDLSLNGATLESFDLTGCRLRSARFIGARFHGKVSFIRTEFRSDVRFDGARFLDEAPFNNARFVAGADFEQARFFGRADFSEAKFFDDISYHNVRFDGGARFVHACFGSGVVFSGASFIGFGDFYRATFKAPTFFDGAEFMCGSRFDEVQHNEGDFF